MKKLILLRHAKSSWRDTSLGDHDRPLNSRGEGAAPIIGGWLQNRGHRPDAVLCSSSLRTRQTVELMRPAMSGLPEPEIEPTLYHASPGDVLARLSAVPDDVRTVMLVGHQPGLGSLVRKLSDGHENRRCRRAFEHFPTAAAAVLEVPLDTWSDLDYAVARFVDFAKPRELQDA